MTSEQIKRSNGRPLGTGILPTGERTYYDPINTLPRVEKTASFEDMYQRRTMYVEKSLWQLVENVAGSKRGMKAKIINAALRAYLSDPENIKQLLEINDWEQQFYTIKDE